MALRLVTAPTVEPLTLTQVKNWMRLSGTTLASDVTQNQTIVPDAHGVGMITGTGIDVLGNQVLVTLNSGTYTGAASNAAKLQDSDNNTLFTDVTGGGFTTVTTANDNAIQEIEYTGTRQYLRVVATVTGDVADFSATITEFAPTSSEDDLITALIVGARQDCEDFQKRAYITQVWDLWLDSFPRTNWIQIPLPQLQSGASTPVITFFDVDDSESTFSADEYFVDTQSEPGRIVLNFGDQWPQDILRPANGVKIRFTAGYGDAATDVPQNTKLGIRLLIAHLYENREATSPIAITELPLGVKYLLSKDRVYDFK